ncbi:hypothetical protein FH972_023225 [Carpinus fangiana]|uniref:Uncharacterized protein n=1 Tax=Carpinus fangiana TaxID=176857 RepID=A0A5N6KUK8_9ROSI|nr:hypothetical protein FH972_023225 [Carpinus fangiana]
MTMRVKQATVIGLVGSTGVEAFGKWAWAMGFQVFFKTDECLANSSTTWAYAGQSVTSTPVAYPTITSTALTGVSETTRLYFSVLNTALSLVPFPPVITSASSLPSPSLDIPRSLVTEEPGTPDALSVLSAALATHSSAVPPSAAVPTSSTVPESIPPNALSILSSALEPYNGPQSSTTVAGPQYTLASSAVPPSPINSAPETSISSAAPLTLTTSQLTNSANPLYTSSVSSVEASSTVAPNAQTSTSESRTSSVTTVPSSAQSTLAMSSTLSPSSMIPTSPIQSSISSRESGQSTRPPSASNTSTSMASEITSQTKTYESAASTLTSITQAASPSLPTGIVPAATTAAPLANEASTSVRQYPLSAILLVILGYAMF